MNTYKLSSVIIAILLIATLFIGVATTPAAAQTANMKHFVFRDDDICPFGALNALEAVDQVHIDENVPVTLGVVAHPDVGVSGNELFSDNDTLSYLKSLVGNPLFEIAQHGYTHSDPSSATVGASARRMVGASPYQETLVGTSYSEFKGLSYTDQYNKIKQGRDDITEALEVTPTTFIPPWNSGDTNTLTACTALGFKLYSTGYEDFSVTDATMQGIRVQAASLSMGWDTTSEWQTNMATLTSDTDSALNSASSGQDIVLFYHYWQFRSSDGSVDPVRISLFEQYIDHLKSRGDVQFTTLGNQDQLGITDLFSHNADDALWYKQRSGQYWSAWASLGGALNSSPAAVSSRDGWINVFARGTDGAVWMRATTDGGSTWSGWQGLGGQLANGSGPAACSWAAGRLDLFVVGTDNKLWHKSYTGTWSGWESLGGACTGSPGVTSQTSGSIDVFVRGTDGAVWQRTYSNNAWSGWKGLGGALASGSGPAACSWAAGRLDLFVQGTDNVMWHKSYTGTWSGWESLGGALSSSPAATSSANGRIETFVRGTDAAVWQRTYSSNAWAGWKDLGGQLANNTAPAACS
ncbi:MAG: DUF2334 domain-containing protein [Halobacteriota archaeon]